MKAAKFDEMFDNGESVIEHLDLKNTRKPNLELKRINIDIPVWIVESLDKEAKRIGISRQAIIKIWLAEHL
ncbi:MAG: CopG family transcriptional regulator [Deltaproteobacteria bacterium]|nr:CopG family transcriptional regulator [Deltaproteobacteria bacterium]